MLLDRTDPRPDPAGHCRVKATRFDRGRDLIIVEGRIWGGGLTQTRLLRLVLDTGAGETIIVPDALDELGYSARQGEERTVVRSENCGTRVYRAVVRRMRRSRQELSHGLGPAPDPDVTIGDIDPIDECVQVLARRRS